MAKSVDERVEDCGDTAKWAMHSAGEVALLLERAGATRLAEASHGTMSDAFLTALRLRDVSKACEIGHICDNWPAMALGAIAWLDDAWNDDTLSIGEIAETYWTLRRTIDELISPLVQTARTSLVIGKAVIWIPSSEQHTFGPQLLVDNVRRIGWDAHLWHDSTSEAVLDQLRSNHVDVVGISIGTDNRLDGLANLISEIRRSSINPEMKILVGGSAICGAPSKFGFLGADRVAMSSEETLRFFERDWSDLERREGRFNG